MRTKLLSLALLLLLAFSLSAGARPCGEMGRPAAKPAAAPSCHEMTPTAPAHGHHGPSTASPEKDGSEPMGGAHPCPHVCHAVAIASLSPALSVIAPVAVLPVSEVHRPLAQLVQAIDHIPLS